MTAPRTPARLAAAAAALVVLAGCTGTASPGPGPTPEPSGTAALTLGDPASLRADGASVTVGDVALTVWPGVGVTTSEPDADGAVVLAVPVPAIDDDTVATEQAGVLVAPDGMTLDVLEDDSAVVRDGAGAVVAALSAPALAGEAAGSGAVLAVDARDDGTVTWSVIRPVRTDGTVEPPASGTVTATLAATAVRSATWSVRDDEGGESLAVVPADWARRGGVAAEEAVWAQVVALAPDAGTQGMHDQLTCHMIGAPDKASWNLEPWRPEVGLLATIGALCNPE